MDKEDVDAHFWVSNVANRLPVELLPKNPTWSSLLRAITQLKTERNNAIAETERLQAAIKETLEEREVLTRRAVAAAKKWFYESFDDDLLDEMQKHGLIAQAEGFSLGCIAELEIHIEAGLAAKES